MRDKQIEQLVDELNCLLTQKKSMELEFIKKEKQLKETITNISHDIRTPLTSLNGYFELLSETVDETEKEQYTVIIQERITSLKDILEQLFTLVKLQNSSFELECIPLNLTQILCEAMFAFYNDFKQLKMEPDIHIPEQSYFICANEVGLKRTIQNIIKNSLDHGTKQITIKLEKIDKKEKQTINTEKLVKRNPKESFKRNSEEFFLNRREQAVIRIENKIEEGSKIEIDKVFERFYTEDKARNKNSTGLGLFIAKELTEKMGGRIKAERKENNFCIQLTFDIIK